jgi:hypothetical protein
MKISPVKFISKKFPLMKAKSILVILSVAISVPRVQAANDGFGFVSQNDVTWNSLGTNENDSMPVGNGDLAANVWAEQNGDILILLAKSDSWAENCQLLKLGRVRVHLEPNPFMDATGFTQTLRLENGSIELKSGKSSARIWVDANHPALHLETHLENPAAMRVKLELWRKPHLLDELSTSQNSAKQIDYKSDLVFPAEKDRLTWCHFNGTSVYPEIMEQEHLGSLISKYPDPLLHRCFGAVISGTGLVSADDKTLKSATPQKDLAVEIIALTEAKAASPQNWQKNLDALADEVEMVDLQTAWKTHQQWWQDFWNRSWIHVSGSADAEKVSQGYAMQRYMVACSSRGAYPVKFNGGLFTVGHDMSPGMRESNTNHSVDFRAWGECFWNQNNRLLYWPLLATGDYDLLQPWFQMYMNALPLAKDRMQLYYQHAGASLPETMYFFGLPRLGDFGKNNPSNVIESRWQRYHIQGTLEVIAQMLDYYDHTGDENFARTKLIPFADAIVTFYDQHYPRDNNGKILMAPAQSLETYQLVATNPTPDIAGLRADIPRLLALPQNLTSENQRAAWEKALNDLPPIPLGRTTAKGKIPPFGQGDPNGLPTILPAEFYGKTGNSENPELYVAFPYRLYGVGKPDLALARTAYAARRSPQNTCWGQDGTQSAVLGLTDEAQKSAVSEFTNYGDERFPWFWKPAHDWIPDLDNGGDGMITLQQMLMQCDGKKILLLPAWPKNWTADFKLHAPLNTTVEALVQDGKISGLEVTPTSRTKDVETWIVNANK